MLQKDYIIVLIGAIAGVTAYLNYPRIGVISALIIVFGVSWFLWRFTTPKKAVYTLGYLKSPPIAAFMIFLGCFLYPSFQGYSSANTWLYSFGIGLIGGLVSIVLNTVWSIDG